MEQKELDECRTSILLDMIDGSPSSDLLIDEDIEAEKLANDFYEMFTYASSPNFVADIKKKFQLYCKEHKSEAYDLFKNKLDNQIEKIIAKETQPFVTPLDVFRRLK